MSNYYELKAELNRRILATRNNDGSFDQQKLNAVKIYALNKGLTTKMVEKAVLQYKEVL